MMANDFWVLSLLSCSEPVPVNYGKLQPGENNPHL